MASLFKFRNSTNVLTPPSGISGAQVACSSTATFCTSSVSGQPYAWGKWKASGDNTMYPKPYQDLSGWTLKAMACGANTYAVAAAYGDEQATVTW